MSNDTKKMTLEFNLYPDDDCEYQHRTTLSVEVSEDMHCAEFHRLCRYFGIALGYAPETIDKYFGDESDDDLW